MPSTPVADRKQDEIRWRLANPQTIPGAHHRTLNSKSSTSPLAAGAISPAFLPICRGPSGAGPRATHDLCVLRDLVDRGRNPPRSSSVLSLGATAATWCMRRMLRSQRTKRRRRVLHVEKPRRLSVSLPFFLSSSIYLSHLLSPAIYKMVSFCCCWGRRCNFELESSLNMFVCAMKTDQLLMFGSPELDIAAFQFYFHKRAVSLGLLLLFEFGLSLVLSRTFTFGLWLPRMHKLYLSFDWLFNSLFLYN